MRMYIKPLTNRQLNDYLQVQDLTRDSDHVLGQVYQQIESKLRQTHPQSKIMVCRLDPIVPVRDNYDALLIDSNNISRSSTYTHYVDKDHILRTHTTAHIPAILRGLAADQSWDDVLILLPGLAYRRDVSDKKHVGEVHMLDVWRVVRNNSRPSITKDDLLRAVHTITQTAAPGWRLRIENSPHPYTNGGLEVNAVKDDRDIEILECGLIKEQILNNAGLDPAQYSGWALGMGLDRLVMTLKQIPDVRHLRSTNPKIAQQMTNLKPYRAVSDQPAIIRDLSYSVPASYVEEDISADIREALDTNIDALEEVEILQTTDYAHLPKVARQKLGIHPSQKNVLVRITLRRLERTLTNKEANALYDQIYPRINHGAAGYL